MSKVIYTFIMNKENQFEVKYVVPPHYRVQELPGAYSGVNQASQALNEAVPDVHVHMELSLFNQLFVKENKEGELPRLFIFQRLTGKLHYESGGDVHRGRPFEDRSFSTQEMFERAAKWLNEKLSLCWLCGDRAPLVEPHLVCEPCNHNRCILTQEQYAKVQNEEDSDFCDCCGDKTKIAGLSEAQIPDLDRPEQMSGYMAYPLLGGFHVCYPCAEHCESRACQPDNLVVINEPLGEQTKSVPVFDWSTAVARYNELYAQLQPEYSEEGVKIQNELDALEEFANSAGKEFKFHDGKIILIEQEHHD